MRQTDLKWLFKTIRKTHKITQAMMAENLGIKQPILSFYENGKANIPVNIVCAIISEYGLNKEDAELLKCKRITKHNLKAVEVLEELKYTIWINQHDDGYLDEQIDIYELTEWIDNKINKLKK